jgi:hypothetical protein
LIESGSYLVGTYASTAVGASVEEALALWDASAAAVGLSKREVRAAVG